MRIAIVANTTWNIYNFRLNFIRKLLSEKHEVIVVAPLDEYIFYKDQMPKVKHIPLKNLSRKNTNPLESISLIIELKNIYKKLKPDLVIHYTHKPNIFGGIAARLTKTRSVAIITGLGYAFIRKGWLNMLTRRLYAFTSSFHKKVLFENEDDLNLFVEKKIIKLNQGGFTNGCGVDIEKFKPIEIQKKSNVTVFTFISRLLLDKGITEFVHAAAQIRQEYDNVSFSIIGELDEGNPSMIPKSKLLQWIEEGFVSYHGFLKDVRPSIAQADCIILPSYREGMSRIILESMSMARPIITTDVPGCRQTVVDGLNGYLVEAQSTSDLISAIKQFLELDPKKRRNMGVEGRKLAISKFNSEKISKELYEIILQV